MRKEGVLNFSSKKPQSMAVSVAHFPRPPSLHLRRKGWNLKSGDMTKANPSPWELLHRPEPRLQKTKSILNRGVPHTKRTGRSFFYFKNVQTEVMENEQKDKKEGKKRQQGSLKATSLSSLRTGFAPVAHI